LLFANKRILADGHGFLNGKVTKPVQLALVQDQSGFPVTSPPQLLDAGALRPFGATRFP
jgi:hypothetical protein